MVLVSFISLLNQGIKHSVDTVGCLQFLALQSCDSFLINSYLYCFYDQTSYYMSKIDITLQYHILVNPLLLHNKQFLMINQTLRYLFGVSKVLKGPPVKKPSTRILTYNVKQFEPAVDVQVQKSKLSPYQLYLHETKSMERPYTGHLWSEIEPGDYRCYVCNNKLFTSHQKFFPDTGMASFWTSIPGRVTIVEEEAIFQKNPNYCSFQATQVIESVQKRCECGVCNSHLGAVYFDGPAPTNLRFSINSECLVFQHSKDFPDPNIARRLKKAQQQKVKYEPITKW